MLAGILLLATIALIVLKAAGIIAVSWFIALLPAIILLALGLIGALAALAVSVFAASQARKADASFEDFFNRR